MAGFKRVLTFLVLFVVLALLTESTAAKHYKRKKASHLNKKQLLKSYTNGIDHGPAGYKTIHEKADEHSTHLLGHKGEYWAAAGLNNKKKEGHIRPIKDFDDARLQDLAYEAPNKPLTNKKKTVKKLKARKGLKKQKKNRKYKKTKKMNKRNRKNKFLKKFKKNMKNPKKYYKMLKKQHHKKASSSSSQP